jgi:hypothetical protein
LRAFSFPLSALPVLVASAAVRPIAQWRWDILVASVLGAVLLHAAGMVGVAGLLCLFSIVPAYRLVRQVYGSGRIPDMDARTARCATLFLLALWLGVTIA